MLKLHLLRMPIILGQSMAFIRFTIIMSFFVSQMIYARHMYLNGIDISSAQDQVLENVNVRIDSKGNIYIQAPHYQVKEEKTYLPLSQKSAGLITPDHSMHQEMKHMTAPQKAGDLAPPDEPASNEPAN